MVTIALRSPGPPIDIDIGVETSLFMRASSSASNYQQLEEACASVCAITAMVEYGYPIRKWRSTLLESVVSLESEEAEENVEGYGLAVRQQGKGDQVHFFKSHGIVGREPKGGFK